MFIKASKEASSSTIYIMCININVPITNSHHEEEVRRREEYVCVLYRKRDRLMSEHIVIAIVVTICMQYQESEGERRRAREKKQLHLLQFMTRENNTLIPINCSVHEKSERIMQALVRHRHSNEFK